MDVVSCTANRYKFDTTYSFRWLRLGLQGSLLSLLIPPIKLESITIGGDCPFSLDAMERGLYKRFNKSIRLEILQAKSAFVHKKGQQRLYPCPVSIIWCAVRNRYRYTFNMVQISLVAYDYTTDYVYKKTFKFCVQCIRDGSCRQKTRSDKERKKQYVTCN